MRNTGQRRHEIRSDRIRCIPSFVPAGCSNQSETQDKAVFPRLQPNAVIDLDNDPADIDKAAIVSWCKGLKPHQNAELVRDGQWRCATCGWTGTKRRSLCAARRAASGVLLELSLRADLCLTVQVPQMTLAQRLSIGEILKSQLQARDRAFGIVKPLL